MLGAAFDLEKECELATAHVNRIATAVQPGGKDLFFHRSAVEGARFEDLQQGQRISLTEGQGPKGPRAEHVKPI